MHDCPILQKYAVVMGIWTVVRAVFINLYSLPRHNPPYAGECVVCTVYIKVCVLRHCITFLVRFGFFPLAVGLSFAGVTFPDFFVLEHPLQVASFPLSRRFFCELENCVCSGGFPHNRQTTAAAEDAAIAGEPSGWTNINIIGSERKVPSDVGAACMIVQVYKFTKVGSGDGKV